ncbi:MAG: hypothetical protein WA231_15900 [Methylocella sp.]
MAVAVEDPGRKARFEILHRDVERKVLEPLRTHNWAANIEREVGKDEYFIIAAERAGVSHRIAVFYTSATANGAYKQAAAQVEHIFFNGAPYMVESFAYGLDRPVEPIDAFPTLLLQWNAATADGKFAPAADIPLTAPATRRPFRMLLSEQPIESIWLRLRQLQSVTLARKLIEERARREGIPLDAAAAQSKADGVAYALRNASDYFQASDHRNVSQRVLNLYYGSLAFAFAEILAAPTGPSSLAELEDTTKQGHGLYTLDGEPGGLEQLVVGIISNGFFPAWMKAMGMDTAQLPAKKPRRYQDLADMPSAPWATVERLFAAIPEIADLFADIFDSPPAWVESRGDMEANLPQGPATGAARSRSYIKLVDEFGRLTPKDIAEFPGPISEIAEVDAKGDGRHFRVAVDHLGHPNAWGALDLHHSPFKRSALLMPVLGGLKEYRATCVVLLYALSIVVRYRPGVWRRVQEGDLDHLRVLVEAFLFVVERILPEQFLETVSGQRVYAKQPGTF